MSSETPSTNRLDRRRIPRHATRAALRLLHPALSAVSFWSAIALPALYVPFLLAGIDTTEGLFLFLGLFGLHAVSLVCGRSYRR